MKKIAELLSNFPVQVDVDQTMESLLENPNIRAFVVKHDLTHAQILASMNSFLTYLEEQSKCNDCTSLLECHLSHPGMTPQLFMQGQVVSLEYVPCKHNVGQKKSFKIDALYIPKKVFEADLSDMDMISQTRRDIYQFILQFLNKYKKGEVVKGLYLSGLYGTGKTYILACIANEVAKLDKEVIFAYYPDLVREMKSSIGVGGLEERISRLKTIPVLILDDIGGESPSAFIRDEVLGPILQHRVLDQLPTFFSSNIPMIGLIESMVVSTSVSEKAKAARIHSRIKDLATEIQMSEKPLRTT
jgi:primosomal protein DnaI